MAVSFPTSSFVLRKSYEKQKVVDAECSATSKPVADSILAVILGHGKKLQKILHTFQKPWIEIVVKRNEVDSEMMERVVSQIERVASRFLTLRIKQADKRHSIECLENIEGLIKEEEDILKKILSGIGIEVDYCFGLRRASSSRGDIISS